MGVAAAMIGSTVLGTAASIYSGKRASDAAQRGADQAAQAQARSTALQIEEIRRQFDESMALLAPLINTQYGASSNLSRLLGFDGADSVPATRDPNVSTERLAGARGPQDTELGRNVLRNPLAASTPESDIAVQRSRIDPMYRGIDRDTYVQHVAGDPYAGPMEADPYLNRTRENVLAAPSLAEDERFRFAQDTATVPEQFEESPGFQFAMEQAMKEVERRNSRGGNFGGRALQEASRRAQGEGFREYYNYLDARRSDLRRQDDAAAAYQGREAFDVARGDEAMQNYLARRGVDIGRGDAAVVDARGREVMDRSRVDQAYADYIARRSSDIGRSDVAANQQTDLRRYDLDRDTANYYNYLDRLERASRGGAVEAATGATQRTGTQVAGAYGSEGNYLSRIYTGAGENEANIRAGTGANVNDALQQGIGNYLYYQRTTPGGKPNAPAPNPSMYYTPPHSRPAAWRTPIKPST